MGQIFVHRETVMWQCRLSPTVFESVGERWRDGAGSSPTLGINHRDACTHHCVGPTPPIFDCRETVMGAAPDGSCAGWRAQYASVSGSDGATAQAECLPWVSGRTDACWRGVDVTRFSTVEKR